MMLKIAILGCRGIPNLYGGFEQFAEIVSRGLVEKGHSVTVYNASYHPYAETEYAGVRIVKKWCPEKWIGSAAHFIYDFLCLRDAVAKKFDVILELGYQSSAISLRLCRLGSCKLVTNMDGLEWKREKWGRVTKALTKWFEKQGATLSDRLVSDNTGIQDYLMEAYGKESIMIPYGSDVFENPKVEILKERNLIAGEYFLLIARMEPENNIQTILDGYVKSGSKRNFVVIGGTGNKYGRECVARYSGTAIEFVGGIYNLNELDNLRYFSRMYFHGHSVGGTNPSLLEAMGSSALICAHDNPFNRDVLGQDAFFFSSADDVASLISSDKGVARDADAFRQSNVTKISEKYSWRSIVQQYERLFEDILNGST